MKPIKVKSHADYAGNIFVISSKRYKNLQGAMEQIQKWENKGTLDKKARIYKTSEMYRWKSEKLPKKKHSKHCILLACKGECKK